MADLPQDRTLEVVFVENRVEVVDLEVVAPSGHVHLRLAAGTAVPVATLVDAVTHLLDLPPGAWRLEAGTHTCQPQEILADHDPIPRLVLEADTR